MEKHQAPVASMERRSLASPGVGHGVTGRVCDLTAEANPWRQGKTHLVFSGSEIQPGSLMEGITPRPQRAIAAQPAVISLGQLKVSAQDSWTT